MKKNKLKNKSLIIKILCGCFAFVGALSLFIFGGAKTYAYEINSDGNLVSQNIVNLAASTASGMPEAAASEVLINQGAETFNYETYVILPTTYNNVSLDPYVVLSETGSTGPEVLDLNNNHYETVITDVSSYDHLFQLYSLNMTEGQGSAVEIACSFSSGYSGSVAVSFDYELIRFSYNSVTRYGYCFHNIMVSETSYNLPYETPGAVYYSSQNSSAESYNNGYDQGYSNGYDNGYIDGTTDSTLYNFLKGSFGGLYSNHTSGFIPSLSIVTDYISINNGDTYASLNNFEDIASYCYGSSYTAGGYSLTILLEEAKNLPFTVNFFNNAATNKVTLLDSSGSTIQVYPINDVGSCLVNSDGSLTYNTIVIDGISLPDANHERGFFRISVGLNTVSYINGYNEGYKFGQASNADEVKEAHDKGYTEGFEVGKQNGYSQALEEDINDNGFRDLFGTILSYPVNMIREAFNFEIFGINVSSLLMFIASIVIVGFIIKKFWK